MSYGWALSQPDSLQLVSQEIAGLAQGYLGGSLPPGTEAALPPLVEQGILAGMQLCAPDFQQEIDATVDWVGANMDAAGVRF